MPRRIQISRKKGWRLPVNAKIVGRPSKYGNPYKAGDITDAGNVVTKSRAVELFRFYLHRKYPGDSLKEFLEPLRGKDLACWCKPGELCHADVLLELANR